MAMEQGYKMGEVGSEALTDDRGTAKVSAALGTEEKKHVCVSTLVLEGHTERQSVPLLPLLYLYLSLPNLYI